MDERQIERGDIYYIVRSYQEEGSEQQAGRPAIVVSNDRNNESSNVVEVVFLTTKPKTDLPTHIDIRSSERQSIALCEQINSVSKSRIGEYIGSCTETEMKMIDAALLISLGIDEYGGAQKTIAEPEEKEVDEYGLTVKVQRDMYKDLYEGLLQRVIGD